MNDHQDFHQFLYGRKAEVECLQAIVRNVLTYEGNGNGTECTGSRRKQDHGESSVERNYEKNDIRLTSRKKPCRIVLVSGPVGSGKRTFIRGAFQLYGGALYSAGYSNETQPVNDRNNQTPVSLFGTYILASGQFSHTRQFKENRSNETISNPKEDDLRHLVAFDDAFQEIYEVLKADKEMLETIRQKLIDCLDSPKSNISLLVESFPCLDTWLLPGSPLMTSTTTTNDMNGVTSYLPTSTQRMHIIKPKTQLLCRILTQFVQIISSIIPIIFILEDLQYVDAASLMVMEELLTCSEVAEGSEPQMRSKGLLLVTTYTPNAKIEQSSALISFLKRYQLCSKNGAPLVVDDELTAPKGAIDFRATPMRGQEIRLTDYSWEDVHHWIKECDGIIQKCTTVQKQELTHLVFHSSNGSPTRIRFFLEILAYDETILNIDINKKSLLNSIENMITSIFLRQNESLQYMLKSASALAHGGLHDIGCDILDVLVSQSCMDNILLAQRCGLLEYVPAGRYVKFYSREIEDAIYRQIPAPNRSSFHLEIGRRIWQNASVDNGKEGSKSLEVIGHVVLAVNQFRCAANILSDFNECLYMSKSCYELGKEALFYKDFDTAAKLFKFSIFVLGQEIWRDDLYETSLAIHNAAAQAYCYMGEAKSLQQILDSIFDNAHSFQDKLPAFVTLVYFQGSWHQLREAFQTATRTLDELGEPINSKPNDLSVAWSLMKTKIKLMGKSIDYLVNLPSVENEIDLIVAQLLCFASIYSYVVKPETSVLLCFRLIRLAIAKGTSGPAAVAFATYGFVLCAMGSFDDGYQYGLVALNLAHKFEVWRPRIHTFVYGYVYHWTHPIRDCIAPLQEAAQSAIVSGDLEIYAGSSFFLNECEYFSGTSLQILESIERSRCQSIALYGHLSPLMSLVPQWSFLKDLTCNGKRLNLPGDITNADDAFKYAVKEGNKYVVGGIYVYQTMWYYLIGDYTEALEMARKAVEQRKLADFALTFYEGLAAVAAASKLKSHGRRKYRRRGQIMAKRLRRWARRCPDNFLNKQLLVDAEIAGLNGNATLAMLLFQESIDKASKEGFIHEEGVAYQRFGHYQLQLGRRFDAMQSFASARHAFDKWGAIRLVRRVDQILATL